LATKQLRLNSWSHEAATNGEKSAVSPPNIGSHKISITVSVLV